MLLLLVQNDEARGAGGKHRAAGAHDNRRVTLFYPLPLVVAFRGGQAAVEHRYGIAKIGGHQSQKLGRQGNLRNQKHGAPAPA